MMHHHLPVSPATVHWGYFSKVVAPALTVRSGDRATIEITSSGGWTSWAT